MILRCLLVVQLLIALPENTDAFSTQAYRRHHVRHAHQHASNTYRAVVTIIPYCQHHHHHQRAYTACNASITTMATNNGEKSDSKIYDNNSKNDNSNEVDGDEYEDDIPIAWSQFQDWALMDNLPKYMIDTNYFSASKKQSKERQPAARWRSMVREVPELTGFDVELVRRQYSKLLLVKTKEDDDNDDDDASSDDSASKNKTKTKTPPTAFLPDMLPLLETYSFEKEGGLSGFAYGIAGVADGTKMTTPPLRGCEVTIPQGWVESREGSCIYELGSPLGSALEMGPSSYSLDYAKQAVSDVGRGVIATAASSSASSEDSKALMNLAALTGMLLASAGAINTISHHVSVHVYWV